MGARTGKVRVGISGWRYTPWRGDFYPTGLPQRRELEYASRAVSSIEINGSFYALQTPQRYADWYADTPKNFVFSVKAPRYITHVKRLRDVDTAIANFFASGVLQLKEKLGPILWQFPPTFKFDAGLFAQFLKQLPHTTAGAVECAQQSDRAAKGALDTDSKKRLRHAVEIRNHSFVCDEFIDLLRRHNTALVVADTAGKWPYLEDVTADFMYLRLHGDKKLYTSGYSKKALDRWHKRIETWRAGSEPRDAHHASAQRMPARAARDVFCYFDNDVKVRAPYDARSLLERLGLAEPLQTRPGDALNDTVFCQDTVFSQRGAA